MVKGMVRQGIFYAVFVMFHKLIIYIRIVGNSITRRLTRRPLVLHVASPLHRGHGGFYSNMGSLDVILKRPLILEDVLVMFGEIF